MCALLNNTPLIAYNGGANTAIVIREETTHSAGIDGCVALLLG